MKTRSLALLLIAVLPLAGCGNKGPLTLATPPANDAATDISAAQAPAADATAVDAPTVDVPVTDDPASQPAAQPAPDATLPEDAPPAPESTPTDPAPPPADNGNG